MLLKENIDDLLAKIKYAADISNRASGDVELIAVTKTVDVDTIKKAIEYGISHIGENKVQELTKKYEQIGESVKWHLIGHLQRNKVKYIIDKVDFIHSLDSYRLAEEIDKRARNIDRTMECFLQVNVSGEKTKHGVSPEDVEPILEEISSLNNVKVVGLMTMAPHEEDNEETRQHFKLLKCIFEQISKKNLPNVEMKYLSMGMSNDFEIAVQEGANFVRVGSLVFGERDYSK